MRTKLSVVLLAGALCQACSPAIERDDELARIEDLRRPDSPALEQALAGPRPAKRIRAAVAMGRIQSAGYVAALADASRHDPSRNDVATRDAALFALGQLGFAEGLEPPRAAVDACVAALSDPSPAIVAVAAEALGKLAPGGAEASILPLFAHPSAEVRRSAADALFRLRFAPVWRKEVDEPPLWSSDAVRELARALSDEAAAVRRAAAHAFSRDGEPSAVAELEQAVGDPDEWVRLFAVRALGRSAGASAVRAAQAGLADAAPRVKTEAIGALIRLENQSVVPLELADDPELTVRAALATAAGARKDASSLETLRRLARDDSTTVRAAAVMALARRLGDRFADELAQRLGDEQAEIRIAAAAATTHLDAKQAALVERAFADEDNRVRVAALQVAASKPSGESRLRAALEADDLAERGTAVSLVAEHSEALELLQQAYEGSGGDAWIEIRESVVDALSGLEPAADLLRRIATDDPVASVRSRARIALGRREDEDGAGNSEQHERETEPSSLLGVRFDTAPLVVLETDRGEIAIRCLPDDAPIHVASFVRLAEQGYYDGLRWHRVVPNFVIQGGDPRGDGWGGAGYLLRDEINRVRFERGRVGMPKAGKDTGGGQIFITHVPTTHLDGNYTIFGTVESGMDVVDRIEVGDRILRARVLAE